MFYLLSVSQTIHLKNELKGDGIIVFQSAELDLTPSTTGTNVLDSMSVNLKNGGDYLLHLCICRAENAIVLNSRTATGNWGSEERETLGGKFVGLNTTITIYDHGDRYQILFNYHTVHYYTKRILKSKTRISYYINEGQSLTLSNPLAVTTYSSLEKLVGSGE
ncbi:galectin [Wilcoxina mikolae CBS 423.85]|nr:galectin [Wilcoxina mikolae CBS 423.85]